MLPLFPDNSRVVFIGDSITAANLVLPRVIHAYKCVVKAKNIRFFNCGVAGGTAEFAVTSFEKDIKRYNPTHAVISFGINDSYRDFLREERSAERLEKLIAAYNVYKKKMSELVDLLLGLDVEVTLCTPVPYDEYSESDTPALRGGYALMLGYSEFVRNLAKEKGVRLYDQHETLSRVMSAESIISSDRIHPTEHGYFVLAREFLKAQGIELGDHTEIPECFSEWHSYVARLRKVIASECMIVNDFSAPTEEKMNRMRAKMEKEDWGQPVFESFIRAYVADKPYEAELYNKIDELYESKII